MASVVSPHLSPVIHSFATPDVAPILARSNLSSIGDLLAPFETGLERVTVRTSTYEARLLPKFTVRFVDRHLPPSFGYVPGGAGASAGRARSGTIPTPSLPQLGGLPHMPSGLEPNPQGQPPLPPATPMTPFSTPNQAERDELFLDSLGSLISQRVDGWINQDGRDEISLRRVKKVKSWADDDADAAAATAEEEPEVDEGWKDHPIERLTPWYAAMRDEIFRRREMVEWETFAWPVGCILALSTSHPEPLNAIAALWDLTSRDKLFAPASYPPRSGAEEDGRVDWADPEALRYIVLVHDFGAGGGRDGWEDAQTLHETIRKTYGTHTALLPLFTAAPTAASPQPRARGVSALWDSTPFAVKPPPPPPPAAAVGLGVSDVDLEDPSPTEPEPPNTVQVEKGQELSDDDLKAVRVFLREMVVQSMIPWMERSVIVGNEQFIASKRSIGGRLFSAGRKYFGGSNNTSRSGSPISATGTQTGYNAVKGYYPHISQESQTRRLADLAFMIGDYKLAAAVYDQASKDYKTDRAWRYYSSACRMAGLSLLMLHPPNSPLTFNPDNALESALQVPPSSGIDFDGLKAMMLYYEVYRSIGDWRAAPAGLVRTAGESEEAVSGVLLEQAAIADLHLPNPARRKFGFHMAMAAARYEKSGLKPLSRRCLSQAASVYSVDPGTNGWTAIRSHIHYGLGRQAYNVGKADEAVEHFLELLVGANAGAEEDGGEQSWLDDFGLAWEHLGPDAPRVVAERDIKLHATIFDAKHAHVRLTQSGQLVGKDTTGVEWATLESDFLMNGFGAREKRPAALIETGTGNEAVVGETFYLELHARNPLDAPLAIGGLQVETDAEPGTVEIEPPQEIELAPREAVRVYVPVRATSFSSFSFTKLSFRFNDLLPCTELLVGRPKRLNATREQLTTPTYAPDKSLLVTVRSPIPLVAIALDDLPTSMYAGEVRQTALVVTNTGQVPLVALRGLCSLPSFAIFCEEGERDVYPVMGSIEGEGKTVPNHLASNTPFTVPLGGLEATLEPGASILVPLVCRADVEGVHNLCWLFVFQAKDGSEHLTSRASHQIEVLGSLTIQPFIRPSTSRSSPYTIGIEATNTGVDAEVVILQISSLSPRWACGPLAGFAPGEDLGVLRPHQSTNVVLAVAAAPDSPVAQEGTEFSVRKLDELLQGKDVTQSVPGSTVLHQGTVHAGSSTVDLTSTPLFTSILATHSQLRHRSLSTQLPTIASHLHQHLFPLFNPRSIDLIVFWSIPSTGARGHHHLADIPLGAGTNLLAKVLETAELKAGGLYAESQRERSTLLAGLRRSELGVDENPVAVVLEVGELVEHDFDADGPCTVPVTFFVRNLSTTAPLDFTLVLQSSDGSAVAPRPTKLPYAGLLTHSGTVAPLAVATLVVPLWIARQGSYDVGDWRLEAVVTGSGSIWTREGTTRPVLVRDMGGR